MTKKAKPCPQCHSVGFHKMSCTEPYKARKAALATTIAHTPSEAPQRAPQAILDLIEKWKVLNTDFHGVYDRTVAALEAIRDEYNDEKKK